MKDNSIYAVLTGRQRDYADLSGAAMERIVEFDRASGFGPGGAQPNRNRFYLYLTQRGSDVQVRTVAVKSAKRNERPVVKEVALASVDDPWIHLKDIAYHGMAGYVVDWTPQGFGQERGWGYNGRWETEPYALRCNWKINAPVVNPELLARTRRFRWSDWESSSAHILDYLKVFSEHPEIEFLSKAGLGMYCTKISVVRKLRADRKFRQFFQRHADVIRQQRIEVPAIMKAYNKGISFAEAWRELEARRRWRGYALPRSICAMKAGAYVEGKRAATRQNYAEYLHNCQRLGLDLADTKVSFPRQFKRRRQVVQDQVDAIRRQENAEKVAKMNRRIADTAEEWCWLEQQRGGYRFVIPRDEPELVAEGRAMANCLGQYAGRIARGELVVVFVRSSRQPDKAFVAAAYDPKKGIVTQCYGHNNSKPPKPVRDFVKRGFSINASGRLNKAA